GLLSVSPNRSAHAPIRHSHPRSCDCVRPPPLPASRRLDVALCTREPSPVVREHMATKAWVRAPFPPAQPPFPPCDRPCPLKIAGPDSTSHWNLADGWQPDSHTPLQTPGRCQWLSRKEPAHAHYPWV